MDINLYKIEAEYGLLGSICIHPEETDKVYSELSPEDFGNPTIGSLYKIAKDLYSHQKEISPQTVASYITEKEQKIALVRSIEAFTTLSTFDDLIEIVKQTAQDKRVRAIIDDVYYTGYTGNQTISILRDMIDKEEKIQSLKKDKETSIIQLCSYLEEKQNVLRGIKPIRYYFGLDRLDRFFGGLKQSTISCIGALPSTGKTDFAIQIAVANTMKKKKTVFFSLEMTTIQYMDRVSAQITNVPYTKIANDEITQEDLGKINVAVSAYSESSPLVVDNVNTLEGIEKIIVDVKPDVVFIDYLQLIVTQKKLQARNYEIEYIGNTLKRVAKLCKCHICVLSQLRRIAGNIPTMQDLKDSGTIEQQCDYIALLHRPYVTNKEEADERDTTLIIDKNKYGQCGKCKLSFNGEKQRFYEVDTNYENV